MDKKISHSFHKPKLSQVIDASDEARKEYFSGALIRHPHLDDVIKKIGRLLDRAHGQVLIVLVGPSGVGKSIVSEHIANDISKRYFALHPDDQQALPAFVIEAAAPESKGFDWSQLYSDCLQNLCIPLIEESLPTKRQPIHGEFIEIPDFSSRPGSLRALRSRLRGGLAQRNTLAMFIDEASNILSTERSQSIHRQANVLKTIVNTSRVRIVLAGAYDLFDLATRSGQLARRTAVIHFEPYSTKSLKDFTKALLSLQAYLPFDPPVSLEPYATDLFCKSLGCIGTLKDILYSAVDEAIDSKSTITKEILADNYFRPEQLVRLRSEMFAGYRLVEGRNHPDDDTKYS
ncbi:TniB family NTP-binding protein [Paraburkholderia nemoris]|uniref:TniB family NTP-binding protein n=1 Tax=Paraburkholderia nemoris TaxID=2793076 RepID=UPI001B20ECB9|nr:TniB family NTP-binding protein [Paraburkholderia nemoris]CAE6849013.1 hypothetical protein LMG22931_07606 [Paraburkholderia nemoris]